MRIVAFDTECANTYKHQVCEFAYIEFDEEFKIINFGDLPIHASEPDLYIVEHFGIDLEKNETAPDYSEVYSKIREILVHSDVCLAYGADNDLAHLCHMNDPYGQFRIDYVLDVKDLIENDGKAHEDYHLDTICTDYGIPLWHHHALFDAAACYELARLITLGYK